MSWEKSRRLFDSCGRRTLMSSSHPRGWRGLPKPRQREGRLKADLRGSDEPSEAQEGGIVPINYKILLCRNHLKLIDAPGASPRRWGAPLAIVQYYLFKNAGSLRHVTPKHRMRPRPRWGQGWRKGGQQNLMKHVFYRAQNFYRSELSCGAPAFFSFIAFSISSLNFSK